MPEFRVICRRGDREVEQHKFGTLPEARKRAIQLAGREAMIAGIRHEPEFDNIVAQINGLGRGCFRGIRVSEQSVIRVEERL